MPSSMNTFMWMRWASISIKSEEGGEMSLVIVNVPGQHGGNITMCAAKHA